MMTLFTTRQIGAKGLLRRARVNELALRFDMLKHWNPKKHPDAEAFCERRYVPAIRRFALPKSFIAKFDEGLARELARLERRRRAEARRRSAPSSAPGSGRGGG
jgi:hypothetical protein